MAPETKTEEEPSIEEILDSIRQIISDDDEEEEAAAAPEPAEDHSDDIIELTDPAEELPEPVKAAPAAPPPPPPPAPVAAPKPEPVAVQPKPEAPPEPEPEPAPEPKISAPEPVPEHPAPEVRPPVREEKIAVSEEVESLLTKNAETAALGAFAELKKKTAIEPAGPTVEEIVRTELRPLLTHWLDKNLPGMVERLVREEIQRVSKEAREE